ncbi:hypothetical protein H5410_013354 [Solanum commersonii]|uniref:Uncharacterized protein n=1 Tax=Solanum commersonii TaxID=4109 RepID=A0A9J6AUD2_SOLCO|nr:hypothetical protein H5410_013354 [Solanum commersonii]
MECCDSTSEDQKCCDFFLLEASGDSHQFDNSKIHQEKCQENCEHYEVEDDAESSNYETKDNLGNSQEVISGFEEDNYDEEEQDDGHKCSIKKEVCKDIVEEKEEEEEDVSSSRAINMEDEVERNRLFWQTCFEVGYP